MALGHRIPGSRRMSHVVEREDCDNGYHYDCGYDHCRQALLDADRTEVRRYSS